MVWNRVTAFTKRKARCQDQPGRLLWIKRKSPPRRGMRAPEWSPREWSHHQRLCYYFDLKDTVNGKQVIDGHRNISSRNWRTADRIIRQNILPQRIGEKLNGLQDNWWKTYSFDKTETLPKRMADGRWKKLKLQKDGSLATAKQRLTEKL